MENRNCTSFEQFHEISPHSKKAMLIKNECIPKPVNPENNTFHLWYMQLFEHSYFEKGSWLQVISIFYTANINKFWYKRYSGHKMSFRAPRVVSHVTEKSQFCFNNLQKKKKDLKL